MASKMALKKTRRKAKIQTMIMWTTKKEMDFNLETIDCLVKDIMIILSKTRQKAFLVAIELDTEKFFGKEIQK